MPTKARKWVMAALDDITAVMPFPIRVIDCDNGSEFINFHLLDWCDKHQITFSRSRVGNKNDGCDVEQKNWAAVRILVGYHRYDTTAELVHSTRSGTPEPPRVPEVPASQRQSGDDRARGRALSLGGGQLGSRPAQRQMWPM